MRFSLKNRDRFVIFIESFWKLQKLTSHDKALMVCDVTFRNCSFQNNFRWIKILHRELGFTMLYPSFMLNSEKIRYRPSN